jgi:hypothetical protein
MSLIFEFFNIMRIPIVGIKPEADISCFWPDAIDRVLHWKPNDGVHSGQLLCVLIVSHPWGDAQGWCCIPLESEAFIMISYDEAIRIAQEFFMEVADRFPGNIVGVFAFGSLRFGIV